MRSEQEQQYVEYVEARVESLRRIAFMLCGDSHRADDLVQQAITKLYLRWSKIGPVNHLDQYVRTILVREFINERRLAWAKVRLFGQLPDQEAVSNANTEDRMVLRAALNKLPPRQRAVLVLRFLCDQSVEDVAELLGCTGGTVKSQTSHGLAGLRRMLEEGGHGEEGRRVRAGSARAFG